MRHRMRNPQGLKVRSYADHLVDINEYLAVFPRANISDKICVTKLNEFLLNNMTNSWSKQAYVQGFECEYINLKSSVNMF